MQSMKSLGALYAELGSALFQAGRYEDAVEALRKALKEEAADVSPPDSYLTLGRAYSALTKNVEALNAFEKAVQLDPNIFREVEKEIVDLRTRIVGIPNKPSAGASGGFADWVKNTLSGDWVKSLWTRSLPQIRNIAFSLVENGKFTQAEQLLKSLVLLSPGDADVQEKLGQALLHQRKQEKVQESIDAFRKAVELNTALAGAHQGLGEAYHYLGRDREAAESLRRAQELKPDDASVLLSRGVILRNLGLLQDSEQALRHAVEMKPEDHIALWELAATLQASDRKTEAADALTQATRSLLQKHDYKEAERFCHQAISLDPSNVPAHIELGRAQIGQKLYDDALKTLEQVTRLNETGEAYIEMAQAHFFLKNFSAALPVIDRALILSPESAEALGLKGMILHRLGKPQEALQLLDQSLTHNPRQVRFLNERAAALEALEQRQDALAAYQQIVELDPMNQWAHNRMGLILFEDGEYERAESELSQALKLPSDVEAAFALREELKPSSALVLHLRIGEALYYIGEHEKAVVAFDKALKLDSTSGDASYYRGLALRRLNRYEEAVAAVQLSIELDAAKERPERANAYAEMGEALRLLSRYREAKMAFKKAITLQENFPWALASYGETLRMLSETEEAAKYLQQAVNLNGRDGWAWGQLGAVRADLKQYRSALGAFEEATKNDASNAFNCGYKGIVLRRARRFEKAIKAFDEALNLDSNVAWIWVEKGMAMREMNDAGYEQALPLLEKATQLDPNFGYAWCQLAICLYRLDRYSEALDSVKKGLTLDPHLTWVYALKSLVSERLDMTKEAAEAHDQALSDPSTPRAYLDRGQAYAELGAEDRASQDNKKALELDPKFADAYNNLAWLYLNSPKRDLEKAATLAQKAVELMDPPDGSILDTLGWIYFKRGLVEKAVPLLEQAAHLDPEDLEIQDHLAICRETLSQRTLA
jgi:tetratricopeptide (TPR) repeat protein